MNCYKIFYYIKQETFLCLIYCKKKKIIQIKRINLQYDLKIIIIKFNFVKV